MNTELDTLSAGAMPVDTIGDSEGVAPLPGVPEEPESVPVVVPVVPFEAPEAPPVMAPPDGARFSVASAAPCLYTSSVLVAFAVGL
jgi:hypothetical protein